MKTNRLMTKLSLVLLLSGFFNVGMTANTVRADDWGLDVGYGLNKGLNDQSDQTNKQHSVHDSDFDTPYGYHLFGPISDVPMYTPSEIKAEDAIMKNKKASKAEERSYEKLDKWSNITKIGKFKVTKAVKKYYNACSVKFKKPTKIEKKYADDIDLVHHNAFGVGGFSLNGRMLSGDTNDTNQDANVYDNAHEYGLGYKKINGVWMELIVSYSKHKKLYLSPEFEVIKPMPSKAVYKVIKHTNVFDPHDDGTANGFGDQDHQYAQVTEGIEPGVKIRINDSKINWRATYNNQKLYGGKMYDCTREFGATDTTEPLFVGGNISMINFNKYFKRIK
ncbi:MAG: hypothetical protein LKH59_01555 [Lactobacillus crispatus]|jgi:hypothetical protein|nr:hypothetical protein [Lactobacillus crispatus]MCI1334841.1 hypothetical protein [Lactobacillus crispatus]MCI1365280.1 hypothetical protein [Lactobacillus crispatus]MCI1493215.1 hypothetical protein [Lactobacillus crispatus]MCI1523754.1 hypothetical protein [Lactobacillus crispatus]